MATDPVSGSLLVADGWGVAWAALRLHRFSLSTGEEQVSVRTKNQAVSALRVDGNAVLMALHNRVQRLLLPSLDIAAEWRERIPRYAQTVLPLADDALVLANWMSPTIGILDSASGQVRLVRSCPQPVVIADGSSCLVFGGCDGGWWRLDTTAAKLTDRHGCCPVSHAAGCGDSVWCSAGGALRDPGGGPKAVTRESGSDVFELTSPSEKLGLAAPVDRLIADQNRLWAICGQGQWLQQIDAAAHTLSAAIPAPTGSRWRHIEPRLGMAFAVLPQRTEKPSALIQAYRIDELSASQPSEPSPR